MPMNAQFWWLRINVCLRSKCLIIRRIFRQKNPHIFCSVNISCILLYLVHSSCFPVFNLIDFISRIAESIGSAKIARSFEEEILYKIVYDFENCGEKDNGTYLFCSRFGNRNERVECSLAVFEMRLYYLVHRIQVRMDQVRRRHF